MQRKNVESMLTVLTIAASSEIPCPWTILAHLVADGHVEPGFVQRACARARARARVNGEPLDMRERMMRLRRFRDQVERMLLRTDEELADADDWGR